MGTFNNYGTITNPPTDGTINKASQVVVTFQKGGTDLTTENPATYGDTITITATASEKTANRSRLKAAPSTVDFYLGSVENGKKLNPRGVSVSDGKATLTITLAGEDWKKGFTIGDNIITADFGGISGSLVDSTGTGTLTVTKATQTVTNQISYGATSFTYGDAAVALATTPTFSPSGAITYKSSDSNVISVDETSGKITFNKAGTATITATNAVANYTNIISEVTLTVTRASQAPTDVTVSSYAPTFGGDAPTITQVSTSESATVTYTAVTDTTDSGTTSQVASITGTTITINKAGTFYVKAVIAVTTNYKEKIIYSEAITVGQATQAKPSAPTSGTVSIANGQATVALATVSGQNYIYTTTDSTPAINGGTDWTTATGTTTNFTGLTIGTSYYFWTYIPGDDNHNPSTVSDQLKADAIVAPAITIQPTSATVIWGNTTSFTVAASGGQLTYQWQVSTSSGTDWSNVASGGTSVTYTTPDTTKTMNGYQYKCVVTNDKGNATTNAATLTVNDKKISIAAITGVTAPTRGGTPVTVITETDEYTGSVSWSPTVASGGTFAADTIYTATITLTAKPSYTLTGVTANFFKVLGANNVTNSASSSSVTAVFPTTEKDTYTITATPQTLDFGSLPVGYPRPNAQTVTVKNTGNMSVNVTLPTATNYDVTVGNGWSDNTATLAPNGTATFTVQPNAGLAVGSHNATLTANTGDSTSVEVLLTFGVTEKAHEHSFGTEWKYDADNHWHECTASDNAKSEPVAHTYGAWTITISATSTTAGSRTRTCTVCANSQTESIPATGGSSGGSTGGSGSSDPTPSIPPTTPPDPNTPNAPINGSTTIVGEPDNDGSGNVTVTIPDKNITEAINAAKQQAGKNAISVTANIQTTQTANSLTAILSKTALDTLISENVRELKIGSSLISYSFNLDALIEIQKSVTGNLTIVSAKQDVKKLSKEAQTAIGSRPVFNITMQSGSKTITQFGKGIASVWIPYIPTADENEGRLQAAYVDANGNVSLLTASSYSKNAKALLFSTNHLSVYGVGYKALTTVFTDTAKHWAKDDIDFVAARGLLSGTGKTAFSPDQSMTRGMFVTALGRLAGVDTKKYSNTKFTDVKADAYYSPYVAWANVNNIVNGTTATTFSPDQSITRQEMAVMLVNYSKAIGYKLPSVHAQVTFTDSASIGTWAKDAVKQMQMAGILMGKSGNKFDPTATATRAEVSAMLRRYVELVVSTETAEGWAMNESGQWMYIQDGKRTTGKKTVDGKAYEFDKYGVTTALLPERKYGVHTVKKGESFWSIAWKYKVSMFELTAANGKSIFSIIYAGDELKIPQK